MRLGAIAPEASLGWMNDIRAAIGVKGQGLFHSVCIALTGARSEPELDKLLQLLERGAVVTVGEASVEERIGRFLGA